MPRPALTAQAVRQAEPEATPYEIRSKRVPGLLLRVQPTGHRTYYAQVGRGKRLKLGDARILSLERAEALAREAVLAPKAFEQARKQAVTLGAFIDDTYTPWVLVHKRSGQATLDRLASAWGGLWGVALGDVTAVQVSAIRTKMLQAGSKPSTVNRHTTALQGALTHAVSVGLIPINPLHGIGRLPEAGGRLRFLSDAEVARLEKQLAKPAPRQPAYLRPLVLLALNTGLRRGALLALRWNDVNWQGNTLTALGQHAKTAKTQYLPLNKSAVNALIDWVHSGGKETDLIFPSRRTGKRIHDITQQINTLFANAKIEGASFHTLRHTFASRLVARGVPLPTVQALLGHSKIETTMVYAHLSPGADRDAVDLL